MIDPAVQPWLEQQGAEAEPALVVQFSPPSAKELSQAKTRAAKIEVMGKHVSERLAFLVADDLKGLDIRIQAAIGQAIIQAPRSVLKTLTASSSALAKATDAKVRPNVLMPGAVGR